MGVPDAEADVATCRSGRRYERLEPHQVRRNLGNSVSQEHPKRTRRRFTPVEGAHGNIG
jgi:hypothetical protein